MRAGSEEGNGLAPAVEDGGIPFIRFDDWGSADESSDEFRRWLPARRIPAMFGVEPESSRRGIHVRASNKTASHSKWFKESNLWMLPATWLFVMK